MTAIDGAGECQPLRVLSYNVSFQPILYGAYQHERIDTFLSLIEGYDILLLQEVYPTSAMPYTIQRFLCSQRRLLDGLKAKGFHYYVISRQPSYKTMLQFNVTSSNGLVIASRFPIYRHGSHTFRNNKRCEESGVTHGCLFAEVEIPQRDGGNPTSIVFFNLHLKPSNNLQVSSHAQSPSSHSSQAHEARQFVHRVMSQLSMTFGETKNSKGSKRSSTSLNKSKVCDDITSRWMPFVIAGDFNTAGADPVSFKPSKEFLSLLVEFDPLSKMNNLVFEEGKTVESKCSIPPSRSSRAFFSSAPALDTAPLRQDYVFVSRSLQVMEERIEKFMVGRRPYVYLSDHFGIAATLAVPPSTQEPNFTKIRSRLKLPVTEETMNESTVVSSHSTYYFALLLLIGFACVSFYLSWRFVFVSLIVAFSVTWFVVRSFVPVSLPPSFAVVNDKVLSGTSAVELQAPLATSDPLEYHDTCLTTAWNRAANKYFTLPCLTSLDDVRNLSSLSYMAADERARLFGKGLLSLGVAVGDKVGVYADACRDAMLLDIACVVYGFASVSLTGRGGIIRGVLDQNHIRVVCSTPSKMYSLLTSRSTALETIICFDGFPGDSELAMAKDLNITILSCATVRERGRSHHCSDVLLLDRHTVWTYAMNDVAGSNFTELFPVTHEDVLRDIKALQLSGILPRNSVLYLSETERFVWYSPYDHLFPRVCALGLLFTGGNIVVSDFSLLERISRIVYPTFFVAEPDLFRRIKMQMARVNKTSKKSYQWLSQRTFSLCSSLIHGKNIDFTILRNIFFSSFHQRMGGSFKKIILYTSQETTSFDLLEFITVCFIPHVREVFFLNHLGVCSIDGVPAPHMRVRLEPMDELSTGSGIGQLCLTRAQEPEKKVGIAARWEKQQTLTLLDAVHGVLWPVDYHYSVAIELERMFSVSRYVNDIFITCTSGQFLIAVVYPNKDTMEYAWRQASAGANREQFGWKEIVSFGADVVLDDLQAIGKKRHLHTSQIPQFIHLHPHSFHDHVSFVNPFGKLCRPKMTSYFETFFNKIYNSSPLFAREASYHDLTSDLDSFDAENSEVGMTVPMTIDIGGTFAKIAYIMPPRFSQVQTPDFIVHEASSLSRTLGIRVFHFFNDEKVAEGELSENPASAVGTIRFMKVPTARVTELADIMKRSNALAEYKREYVQKIRATGGGSFKYAHVAKNVLGLEFDVVKEMDAVVKGLNLVLQLAPTSVFRVNPENGEHLPHMLQSPGSSFSPFPYLLINIGSGISFIKCTGPDGSHSRVGGSPIGGATFWGLTRTLTNLTSWEEVLEIMRLDGPGDNKNVDLLVGDIYGFNARDLPAMLSSETVASSFGKYGTDRIKHVRLSRSRIRSGEDDDLSLSSEESNEKPASPEKVGHPSSMDIVRSLLNMLSGNVTQLAYLHSKLHGVKNIFFAGGFVRDNHIMWSLISQNLQYWSSGECCAHFLEHDGYLGALGCTVIDRIVSVSETPESPLSK